MLYRAKDGTEIHVVPYAARHADAFRDLNLDWIEEYFVVEPLDRQLLTAPDAHILEPGGAILMAEHAGTAIGCCALLNHGAGVYEVSKMAIARPYRDRGVGRILLLEVIARARALRANKLTIISNTVLGPAIHLYKSVGFVEVALGSHAYARGNIALERGM